jgi:hypothetical protein
MYNVGLIVGVSTILMMFMICCSYPIWGFNERKLYDEIAIE